jgi:hypothetical protein
LISRWWAVYCPKYVEQLRNIGIINSTARLHLVGYFYEIYITMQGSINIKFHIFLSYFHLDLALFCTPFPHAFYFYINLSIVFIFVVLLQLTIVLNIPVFLDVLPRWPINRKDRCLLCTAGKVHFSCTFWPKWRHNDPSTCRLTMYQSTGEISFKTETSATPIWEPQISQD